MKPALSFRVTMKILQRLLMGYMGKGKTFWKERLMGDFYCDWPRNIAEKYERRR